MVSAERQTERQTETWRAADEPLHEGSPAMMRAAYLRAFGAGEGG